MKAVADRSPLAACPLLVPCSVPTAPSASQSAASERPQGVRVGREHHQLTAFVPTCGGSAVCLPHGRTRRGCGTSSEEAEQDWSSVARVSLHRSCLVSEAAITCWGQGGTVHASPWQADSSKVAGSGWCLSLCLGRETPSLCVCKVRGKGGSSVFPFCSTRNQCQGWE